jgi:hypothetical protein
MQRFSILFVAALLTACQGYYQRHIHGNENSPYFYVPVDSMLVLTAPVTIPAKTEHVFFQNNKLMHIRDVNRYLPYCEIQVSAARSSIQTIEPDEFIIFKVYQLNKFQLAEGGLIYAGTRDRGCGDGHGTVLGTTTGRAAPGVCGVGFAARYVICDCAHDSRSVSWILRSSPSHG